MTSIDLSQARVPRNDDTPASTARSWSLTIEQLAYLGLGLLSLLAHLWMLGDRALHHDETLHAAYSWSLYVGRGYIHDPLLHGPLLYYIGALVYFLFGDNDTTARLGAALAGTALTITPYLIRREIGRPAALIAAVYLLISPVALYVGRFIRHDIYSVLCEMLVIAAIIRYSSTRAPRWLAIGAAALGFMSVNQETSYLFTVIIAVPLLLVFFWRIWKPGIAWLGGLGLAAILLAFVLPAEAKVDGGHIAQRDPQTGAMLIEQPGVFGWPPLATDDNAYALRIRNRADDDGGRSLLANLGLYLQELAQFFAHPAVLIGMGLALMTIGVLAWAIGIRRNADDTTAIDRAIARGDSAAILVHELITERRWLPPLLIFLTIYALFFTAFFSNLLGLITGTSGSLLYWLAQHNVERGGQPPHYYLVQLIVYEPLLLIFGGLGLILCVIAYIRRSALRPQPALFSIGLIAWWTVAAFAIYTWAGEKMPWLTIHIALPLTLLAAWGFQQVVWPARADSAPAPQPIERSAAVVFGSLFAAILGLTFIVMTAVISAGGQSPIPPWLVLLVGLLLFGLLSLGAGLRWGARPAIALLAICVALSVGFYTARSSYRLAYQNGDVPREMMVYTQTSPDVMRIIRRLEEASRRRGNGLAMPVIYDNETVWTWYLRDFTNAQRTDGRLDAAPGPEVMAVLMLQENLDRNPQNRQLLDGFVIQRYPLRWWFPEDQVYRLNEGWREQPLENTSLLGQVLRAPLDRGVNERLWRFLMFRDPGAALGSTDMIVAVRPEIADQIGIGLGGELRGETP